MKILKRILSVSIISLVIPMVLASISFGAGSGSIQPEVGKDIKFYNKGVDLLMAKDFASAEKQFRKALNERRDFAEAHNNLAYVLRKQGPDRYDEALDHYNRAVGLKPDLAQPYMYRGVLYVQMGNTELALKDHEMLTRLNPSLAGELEYVIQNGREKEPEQFFGVTPELR
jgi:Tfp pilus assembly protein PilF